MKVCIRSATNAITFGPVLALGSFLCAAIFSFGPLTSAQSDQASKKVTTARPQFIPGELLVRFRSEAAAEREQKQTKFQIESRETQVSIERLGAADVLAGLRLVRVNSQDTLKAVAAFSARSDVVYAEPNSFVHLSLSRTTSTTNSCGTCTTSGF